MKIWHISDTHQNHTQLQVPLNIDMVIHSGDATNSRDPAKNLPEMTRFLTWFSGLPIKHKVFVPGNHDTALACRLLLRQDIETMGITLLLDSEVTIEGYRFYGSPWTPKCGEWAWMKPRNVINRVWDAIPEGVDVLITHGPPKGVLDLTYDHNNCVERIGCGALMKRVAKIQPTLMLFGHAHSVDDIRNSGTRIVSGIPTLFSNGACSEDRKMGEICHHGNCLLLSAR